MGIRVGQYLGSIGSGGIEAIVFSLLEHTDMNTVNWEIVVNQFQKSKYDSLMQRKNVPLKTIQQTSSRNKIINLLSKYSSLFSFLKKEKYDVFHIHGSYSSILIYAVIAKIAGIKCCVVHSHSNAYSPNLSRFSLLYYKLIRVLFAGIPDGYLACSKSAGTWMFGNKDIKILQNGINVKRFSQLKESRNGIRGQYGITDEVLIGHVGRFAKEKNQRFLLDIISNFQSSSSERVKLMLIGDGVMKKEIEDLAEKLGISDSVIFVGNVSDIESYYAAMDVFVFPSIYEGLGITLIEAQAVGLPVLASDTIVDEACLTPLVHRKSLNDSIHSWCDEIMRIKGVQIGEEERCAAIIKAGFDIVKVAEKLTRYYREVEKNNEV